MLSKSGHPPGRHRTTGGSVMPRQSARRYHRCTVSVLAIVIPVVVACLLIIVTSLVVMRIYSKGKKKTRQFVKD